MSENPRFTKDTLEFIRKASRQKKPDWLARNRKEHEKHLLSPLQYLARQLKSQLSATAPGYHFPQKGIGRLKRSARRAEEYGAHFKDWVAYSASRPSESRFDRNPSLFFMINPSDEDGDEVLLAGGLYMPSSRQTRSIREAIAQDTKPFEQLFASKPFSSRFPGGFCKERTATRAPRGFDPRHPKMDWLKLQGFFVWRSYTLREFSSPGFIDLIVKDSKQLLRLNDLLEKAIQGRLAAAARVRKSATSLSSRLERLEELEAPRHELEF